MTQQKELSEGLAWLEEKLRRVRNGDLSDGMWRFVLARLTALRLLAAEIEGDQQCHT